MTLPAKFTLASKVRYQDCDSHLRMTLQAWMGAIQEASIVQSNEVGRGFEWLARHNQAWMIVQSIAKIARLPVWRSQIQVSPWISEFGRFLTRREFMLHDNRGVCGQVTSLWAFIDKRNRKIINVPKNVSQAYAVLNERAINRGFNRPQRCLDITCLQQRRVQRSNLDLNSHANNLSYLTWIQDNLPSSLSDRAALRELDIRYQKEIRSRKRIVTRTSTLKKTNDLIRFSHDIIQMDSNEQIALANTTWKI
jgi:acyl-ACP thioesterase